jgi:hypothetical protein
LLLCVGWLMLGDHRSFLNVRHHLLLVAPSPWQLFRCSTTAQHGMRMKSTSSLYKRHQLFSLSVSFSLLSVLS